MWTVSSRALSSSWLDASCNQYSVSYHTIVEEPPPGGPLGSGRRAGQGFPRKESSLIPQQTMVQTVPPTASRLQDLFLRTLLGSWF